MNIDQLERAVGHALHAADGPVDLYGARRRLAQRTEERQRRRSTARRRLLLAAAAMVVVASVGVPLLRDVGRSGPPVVSTAHQLSPSGLPVGLLEGQVPDGRGDVRTVRMLVRPDGTGQFFGGGAVEDVTFEVEYVALGSGRVVMRYQSPACPDADVLTFQFTVHTRTVVIDDPRTTGCVVSASLADELAGAAMRILPLPVEYAPSGLPVGLLKGTYPLGRDVGTIRLLVRKDGTGELEVTWAGHWGVQGPRHVHLRAAGSDRVSVAYDNPNCGAPEVMSITVTRRSVTLERVATQGSCLIDESLARSISGTVLHIFPSPQGGLGADTGGAI